MTCQKVSKQGRDDIIVKVNVLSLNHPCIVFTLVCNRNVQRLTRNACIQSLVEHGLAQFSVLSSKPWMSPITRKCMLSENWLSDNDRDWSSHRCQTLCWIVSKTLSRKCVTKYYVQISKHNICMLYKNWAISNALISQKEVCTKIIRRSSSDLQLS